MKELPESVSLFIDHVKSETLKHDIKLKLSNSKHVSWGGIKCNGYFCTDSMRLSVAVKNPLDKWLPILIHEFGHMTQWLDNCPVWSAYYNESDDPMELVDQWIEHNLELDPVTLSECIKMSRDCELDCEQRSVELIKEFNLPIHIDRYIRQANAYLFFYRVVERHRRWYKIGQEPYNIETILRAMPKHFDNDYDKVPDLDWELCF